MSKYQNPQTKLTCMCVSEKPLYKASSTANEYSSADHHEQENKKTTGQIKFLVVIIKQQIKLVLQHSLCK